MTYELAIADKTYSSWSLRGWLLFEKFNIPAKIHSARMYGDDFEALKAQFEPTRLVPAAKMDGQTVWDSLAMAEELASRHPDAGYWPSDPSERALARSMVAEMHAGFTSIRNECTMNLRHTYPDFKPSDAVLADVARAELLWSLAPKRGPWLFGDYTVADVFYAPLVTRLVTYHLPVSAATQTYIDTHFADPAFRRWRAMGIAQNYVQPGYDLDLTPAEWPGHRLSARVVDAGPSENETCPYSGKPVAHFCEVEGRVFGMCNTFCRDKTVADAEAFEEFMGVYQK